MQTLPNGYEIYKPKPCFASTKDGDIMRLFNGTWEKAKIYRTGSRSYRCYVCTTYRGVQTSQNATRLIAETFVPNPDGKKFTIHIDGDESNLRADNIAWATKQEIVARFNYYSCSRCGKRAINPFYTETGDVICRKCNEQLTRDENNRSEYERKVEMCKEAIAHPTGLTRADDMKRLREQGVSICIIGDVYGISRERVRQITIKAGYKRSITHGKSLG